MLLRHLILISILLLGFTSGALAQQKINDFYLSNYKDDGSQDWEIRGNEAFIENQFVDIDKMKAKYFAENDIISVTSQEARLDKSNMNVFLKKDVHIENQEGITLDTQSLDWHRDKNMIKTDDWVQADNNSMRIKAEGLTADTQFRNVDFNKNVEVQFPDEKTKNLTTVTCDGPLEIEYNSGNAVFYNNVVVDHKDGTLYSDKATLFFDNEAKKIKMVVSEGNVKIVREDNVTFARKATYLAADGRIVLEGNPRLIYFPKKKLQ